MTKQQARAIYLAGAGLPEQDIQICNGRRKATPMDDNNSLVRMAHAARFEAWWAESKYFSRAKEPGHAR